MNDYTITLNTMVPQPAMLVFRDSNLDDLSNIIYFYNLKNNIQMVNLPSGHCRFSPLDYCMTMGIDTSGVKSIILADTLIEDNAYYKEMVRKVNSTTTIRNYVNDSNKRVLVGGKPEAGILYFSIEGQVTDDLFGVIKVDAYKGTYIINMFNSKVNIDQDNITIYQKFIAILLTDRKVSLFDNKYRIHELTDTDYIGYKADNKTVDTVSMRRGQVLTILDSMNWGD